MKTPCNEPGCAALATKDGKCPPHAEGYRLNRHDEELACRICKRLIRIGHWYQLAGAGAKYVRCSDAA